MLAFVMVHWDDFRFILALYRHGTMTAAASALNTNVATVSRRLERVTEELGEPVFQKEGGGWRITGLGMTYVTLAEEFENNLSREQNNKRHGTGETTTVTLSGPPVLLDAVLFPSLGTLLKAHPHINLVMQARIHSEGLGDADIMVRWGKPDSGRLITRKVGNLAFRPYRLVGSTSDDWVALEGEMDSAQQYQLGTRLFDRPPRVRVSTAAQKLPVMLQTGLAGIMPDAIGRRETALEALSDEAIEIDFWYAFHSSRKGDKALAEVTNWLIEAVAEARRAGIDVMPAPRSATG